MNEFELLLESINTTLKQTKILRYPRQIQLSEEFTRALVKEVSRHMQILDESKQPIKELTEKFLKALKFELTEISESNKKQPEKHIRPRKQWNMNPVTRIHRKGKTDGYNRSIERKKERTSNEIL